ncbi:MAG TPA: hypothetical protein VF541_01150, partial [Longimicrobium sp.]
MFVVYVPDPRFRERVRRAVPASTGHMQEQWEPFERAAQAAECSVAVIPWLSSDEMDRLRSFKTRSPLHPV